VTDVELFEAFTTYQQGRAFSPNTLKRRRLSLARFAAFVAPMSVRDAKAADVDEWLARLRSDRTRHGYRSDLSLFFRWAVRRDLLTENPVAKTDSVKVPRSLPRPVPAEVIAEAYRIADGRIQLAILLGALAGLRVSEIAALSTSDVYFDTEPPTLIVLDGKGGKDRVVPLHPMLEERLRGVASGYLFKSQTRAGHVAGATLGYMIAKVLTQAAGGERYTAHQLRHFCGTEAARWSGGNVLLVSKLLGHDSMNTTMGYIGWSPTEGAEVVAKIGFGVDDELARRRNRSA
jgi:integrase/recombinase XerD